MIKSLVWLGALLLCGCAARRVSQFDEFEKVTVDKMVGNEVTFQVIGKTVICLNAMRESRWPPPVTNQAISFVTNAVVSWITNQTVTSSSNTQLGSNTNTSLAASAPKDPSAEATAPATVAPASPGQSTAGGTTVSTTRNESVASGPNQTVLSRSVQSVTLVSLQNTATADNQSAMGATNQTLSVETNWIITVLTNQVVTPHTNVTVRAPDGPAFDYYLYTEIAPQDFSLASGENLVLLVDGVRSALTPATPLSGWQPRRGYLTTYYRVPPDLITSIANAQEVRLRIKSTSGTVERTLSKRCLTNFRTFLLKNFPSANQETATIRKPATFRPTAASEHSRG